MKLTVHSLTPQRFSTAVFTHWMHTVKSLTRFPPEQFWLLRLTKRGEQVVNRLCHKYVQLLPACTALVTLVCLGQLWPALDTDAPFAQSRALSPSATSQSFKALVCVCSLITANQGKHTLQSGMTSIYTAVCKLFQCQKQRWKQKNLCMKCLVVQDIYTL